MSLPPLHPILVNFTAALLPVSVLCDLFGRVTGRTSLRAAGWWTLVFASAVTPLTVAAGWLWLGQMDGSHGTEMTVHKWLGTSLAAVFVVMLFWRWRQYRRDAEPGVVYLSAGVAVVAALTVQGHLGGSMSFASDGSVQMSPHAHHGHGPTTTTGPVWRDYIEVGVSR